MIDRQWGWEVDDCGGELAGVGQVLSHDQMLVAVVLCREPAEVFDGKWCTVAVGHVGDEHGLLTP